MVNSSKLTKTSDGYRHIVTTTSGSTTSIFHSVADIQRAIRKLEEQRERYLLAARELDAAISKRKVMLAGLECNETLCDDEGISSNRRSVSSNGLIQNETRAP